MAQPDAVAAATAWIEEDVEASGQVESTEAEETPSNQPEGAAEEVQHDAPPSPDPEDIEIPDDIKELLAEPDFDAEVEAEMAAEAASHEDDEEPYLADESLTEERKLRIKAEKRAQFLEEQRLLDKRPEWKKEALRYFPHSKPFIDKIVGESASRRAVLRQANAYNDTIAAHLAEVSPGTSSADRDEIKAEIKAELEQAWGKPLTGPGNVPAEALEEQQAYDAAAKRRDFTGMVRARNPMKLLGL